MPVIYTANKDAILVDDCDFAWLSQYSWYLTEKGYPRTNIRGKGFRMSRMIMDAGSDQTVDHINRDTLDNRRHNLRFVTRIQNAANSTPRIKRNLTSKYKGVSKSGNKYVAVLYYRGTTNRLGRFIEEYKAAMAYDEKAFALHGEFAYLNMPVEPIRIMPLKEVVGYGT